MVSNKERLQANNAEMQELIGVAEALPDAGSGGEEYLAEIESYFAGESNSLTLPTATTIKYQGFVGQTSLQKISLPKVKNIGEEAFSSCEALETIDMPNIETIGTYAFMLCEKLMIDKLPHSIREIERSAFYSCGSITFLQLPSGIQKINERAFQSCAGLTSITILSRTCPFQGSSIFSRCTNLTTINVAWSEEDNPASYPAPWGATNATINYNYTGG